MPSPSPRRNGFGMYRARKDLRSTIFFIGGPIRVHVGIDKKCDGHHIAGR
jgi:hypothetical protein